MGLHSDCRNKSTPPTATLLSGIVEHFVKTPSYISIWGVAFSPVLFLTHRRVEAGYETGRPLDDSRADVLEMVEQMVDAIVIFSYFWLSLQL